MSKKITPIIKQYLNIKKLYPNMLLFYQIGDFYEFFYDDAIKVSNLLNIVLTEKKFNNIPMSGFPLFSADNYILKLINLGESVVLCNQVDDNNIVEFNKSNKLIDRVVTKIITPGTITKDYFLNSNKDNYISSLFWNKNDNSFGYSYLDIFSGRFYLFETKNIEFLKSEILRTSPSELLYYDRIEKIFPIKEFNIKCLKKIYINHFDYDKNYNILIEHFNVLNLDCYGIEKYISGIRAAGYLLSYVKSIQFNNLFYVNKIILRNSNKYIYIDFNTIKNLELLDSFSGNKKKTLYYILNNTTTPMGCRMLKRWIIFPRCNVNVINDRHNIIDFIGDKNICLRKLLSNIGDFERIIGKIFLYDVNQINLISFKNSLNFILKIINLFDVNNKIKIINFFFYNKKIICKLYNLINISIVDPCMDNSNIILLGYNNKLDSLKNSNLLNKKKLLYLENIDKNKYNIKSVKYKYSKLHGYYIQINKSDINLVPDYYIKYQVLKNSVRFFSNKLKKYEFSFLLIKKKIKILEKKIFLNILKKINKYMYILKNISYYLSKLDILSNFLERSLFLNYVKPIFVKESLIKIKNGRHPILECNINSNFISNSLFLNKNIRSLLITGPNMGGKSTYMRQIGLIVIMAYIGSYVPADFVILGPIDRILTRIGFSDDISSNKSTFMIEMSDISKIINSSTYNSLVLIDEMGRGTSFKEGLCISWSCLYYILKFIKPIMLFSTHFIELSKLSNIFSIIKNVYFDFLNLNNEIIYLYKIRLGVCLRSFGIELSFKLGLPKFILDMFLDKFNNSINFLDLKKKKLCFNKKHKIISKIISNIDTNNISIKKLFDNIKYLKSLL